MPAPLQLPMMAIVATRHRRRVSIRRAVCFSRSVERSRRHRPDKQDRHAVIDLSSTAGDSAMPFDCSYPQQPGRARQHEEWRAAITNECWPFCQAVLATEAEIRYARELRMQLRQRYPSRPTSEATPWCVGVE